MVKLSFYYIFCYMFNKLQWDFTCGFDFSRFWSPEGVINGSCGDCGFFLAKIGGVYRLCPESGAWCARNEAKKKVVLFPENGPPAQNKQVKETRIQKKQKKLKKKRLYLRKINLKKLICGRPGKDFSRHPHFRKQVFFFLACFWVNFSLKDCSILVV